MTDRTVIADDVARGLGPIEIVHPPGSFAPTPASRIAVTAIANYRGHLGGRGIDWGSGSGVLGIAAARIPAVLSVLGLDVVPDNVEAARANAARNGVADKVEFHVSDSYSPAEPEGRAAIGRLEGCTDFIIANPPSSSPHDDGFGYRREVVRGAGAYLRPGGELILSVSNQYGIDRVTELLDIDPAFEYAGVLASTDWVPFDMTREDLREDVETYAAEERRGGLVYDFRDPTDPSKRITAVEALASFAETGTSPLSRWQSHLLIRG